MEITKMTLTEFLYEKRDDLYEYLELFDAIEVSNRRKGRGNFYIVSEEKIKELEELESFKATLGGRK